MDNSPLRILLVEDDEDDYLLTRDLFSEIKNTKHHLDWVRNYESALDAIDRQAHDICLVDYRLGERSGLEFLRDAIAKGSRAPIILLTGQGSRDIDLEAMRAGADDYLVKGEITADLLERSIRYAIGRKQAEVALRESETKYRTLVDEVNDGLYVSDNQGVLTFANRALAHILGFEDPGALIGRRFIEFVPPAKVGGIAKLYQTAMEIGTSPGEVTTEVVRQDGASAFVEISPEVIIQGGKPVGDRGVVRDITERMRAEEALRSSEQLLRLIADHMLDLVVLIDLKGVFQYVSPSHKRAVGYAPEELLGKSIYDVVHPEEVETVRRTVREALKTGTPAKMEIRYRHADGSYLWLETTGNFIFDENGAITGGVLSSRDISARKQAEDALRENEERFRALARSANEAIIVIDSNNRIIFWNNSAERLFLWTEQEALGKSIEITIPESRRAAWREGMQWLGKLPQIQSNKQTFEQTGVRKDGSAFPVEISVAMWEVAKGRFYSSIVRDITERKRLEKTLQAERDFALQVMNTMGEGLSVTDAEGRFEYVNPAYARMIGCAPQDLVGKRPQDVTVQEDHATLAQARERRQKGEVTSYETRLKHVGGQAVPVLITAVPRWNEGKVSGAIAAITNMTERKQAEEEIERRAEQLGTLYDAGLALNRMLDPGVQLEFLLKLAKHALRAERAEFFSYAEERNEMRFELGLGYGKAEQKAMRGIKFPVGEQGGVVGSVAEKRVHLNVPDVSADPRWVQIDPEIRSALLAPIRREQELRGVLRVSSTRVNAFTLQDERLLVLFANQVSVAMENARLYEQEQTRRKELAALYDLSRALADAKDFDAMLNLTARHASETIRVTFARVMLVEGEELVVRAAHPIRVLGNDLQIGHREFIAAHPHCRRVLEQGVPVVLRASDTDIDDHEREACLLGAVQTLCLVPLRVGELALGLLMLGEVRGEEREPFTDQKIDLARAIADQAASALHRATLRAEIERSAAELTLAYGATIEGWSRALDLRDQETQGHTQRVAEITVQLARMMGLDEEEIEHVRRGALLHDIGKMSVPDAILLKPGSLTDEEWKVMRKHPVWAFELLSPIAYLRPALDIPYCHHEKWDGTGYPRGLKGEEIPLVARIFAVVDVWDALRSERPYRPAWHKDQVRKYILEQAGKSFDPKIVGEFLRLVEIIEKPDG